MTTATEDGSTTIPQVVGSQPTSVEDDTKYMRLALAEAMKCDPTLTAFCVGCVLVTRRPSTTDSEPVILATGYSRELPGNTHAEANALSKAHTSPFSFQTLSPPQPQPLNDHPASSSLNITEVLKNTDVYTTMEPCSIRTSGLPPCSDALVKAKIRRCVIGVGEPADFVRCEGAERLREAGIEVVWLKGLESECLDVARRGH